MSLPPLQGAAYAALSLLTILSARKAPRFAIWAGTHLGVSLARLYATPEVSVVLACLPPVVAAVAIEASETVAAILAMVYVGSVFVWPEEVATLMVAYYCSAYLYLCGWICSNVRRAWTLDETLGMGAWLPGLALGLCAVVWQSDWRHVNAANCCVYALLCLLVYFSDQIEQLKQRYLSISQQVHKPDNTVK